MNEKEMIDKEINNKSQAPKNYDNCVCLTKEEYSDYLMIYENNKYLKEKCENLQADNERLYKNLAKFKDFVRKETAKEIFEKVFSYMGGNQKFCIVDNDNQTLIDCDKLWEFVDALAKQFGVEIKEQV